jgi:hypothetical protein
MAILTDGHPTTVTFSLNPTVPFCEKEVTPPGMQGGGANDITTMKNVTWRTMAPKNLRTLSEMSMTSAYDPSVYNDIVAMINQNQQVTVNFPDGSSVTFWGWLDDFTPGAAVEGEQPTADVTVIPSNYDDNENEVAPVYTPAP